MPRKYIPPEYKYPVSWKYVEWGVRMSATLNVIVPAPTDRAPLGTGPQNFEQSLLEVQSVVDVKIGFFEEFFHVVFLGQGSLIFQKNFRRRWGCSNVGHPSVFYDGCIVWRDSLYQRWSPITRPENVKRCGLRPLCWLVRRLSVRPLSRWQDAGSLKTTTLRFSASRHAVTGWTTVS